MNSITRQDEAAVNWTKTAFEKKTANQKGIGIFNLFRTSLSLLCPLSSMNANAAFFFFLPSPPPHFSRPSRRRSARLARTTSSARSPPARLRPRWTPLLTTSSLPVVSMPASHPALVSLAVLTDTFWRVRSWLSTFASLRSKRETKYNGAPHLCYVPPIKKAELAKVGEVKERKKKTKRIVPRCLSVNAVNAVNA